MQVRRDWQPAYDVDDVLRNQAADPAIIRARRPDLVALTQRALDAGRDLVEPAVLTRSVEVTAARHNRIMLDTGGSLTGPLITEHLGGAERIVFMLCTVGDRLEAEASRTAAGGVGYALALDAVGSAAVEALTAAACNQIERDAAAAGLQTSLPLSPGMEGWAVDPGQREIFEVLDPSLVGVEVTPTLEMHPLKSITAVIGVGADIAVNGAICDYCAIRETCRHRIADSHREQDRMT